MNLNLPFFDTNMASISISTQKLVNEGGKNQESQGQDSFLQVGDFYILGDIDGLLEIVKFGASKRSPRKRAYEIKYYDQVLKIDDG